MHFSPLDLYVDIIDFIVSYTGYIDESNIIDIRLKSKTSR